MNLVLITVCATMLVVGGGLAVLRAVRGPTMLDRTIALDIVTSCMIGGIAVEAAWSRRIDTVPILAVLALVGFIGSVTIARFAAVEPEGEGRVLSREEAAALEAERIAAEQIDDERRDPHHGRRDVPGGAGDESEQHGGPAHGEVKR